MLTPIRRLQGITYWVIEDPEGIYDYINTEIRKEWEEDVRREHRDPRGSWLTTLPRRTWTLKILETDRIALKPSIMNYADTQTGDRFMNDLTKRSEELRQAIRKFSVVIPPVIVKQEGLQLYDGYCRYSALKDMKVSRLYAYVGAL